MWEWGEVKAWVVMARKARIMCCFIMVFVVRGVLLFVGRYVNIYLVGVAPKLFS